MAGATVAYLTLRTFYSVSKRLDTLKTIFILVALTLSVWAQPPQGAKVKVDSFDIEGMKTLDTQAAQDVLADYLGKELTLEELQRAAEAVSELYRENDYFTVTAFLPEQKLDDGSVTIQVVENSLNDVSIEGNTRYSTEYIRWMIKPVLDKSGDAPPKRADLQRQLLLLNDQMDLNVRSVVKETGTPGQVDLALQVDDSLPTHLTLDYNNLGADFTGRNRLGATFEWGNLTDRADVLSLRYVESDLLNADVSGVDLFFASYDTPLNNHGTRLNFSYANSAFQVGRDLQILDIRGRANVLSVLADHPIIRGTDSNLNVNGGFIYQDIENSILGTQLSEDNLREIVLGVTGDWSDDSGRNYGGARLTQDLGTLLGGNAPNAVGTSRLAGGGFTKLNFDLARVQRVSDSTYFTLRGANQTAFQSLPFAEQYGLGGISTVRGYIQSAYLGDNGYNANAEFRWAPLKDNRDLLELGVFLDHGAANIKRTLPGEISNVSLTGAGVGVHLRLPEETYIRAEVGFPIGNSPVREQYGSEPVPYFIFAKKF